MEAYLLVEHSHHDPEARFSLYDAVGWERIMNLLDSEGWVNENVPELEVNGKRASYGKVMELMAACAANNITILAETDSFMDHD